MRDAHLHQDGRHDEARPQGRVAAKTTRTDAECSAREAGVSSWFDSPALRGGRSDGPMLLQESDSVICPLKIADELSDWIVLKHDLDDAHDEFFRGENREQERQQGRRGCSGQTGDVRESEWDQTHLAHEGIAVAEISE